MNETVSSPVSRSVRRLGVLTAFLIASGLFTAIPAPAQLSGAKCQSGFAGKYPCENVDLLSTLPLPSLGVSNGNDVWGWTDPATGREYAIVGTSFTTGFVDITDPANPVLIGHLPTSGASPNTLWRDMKVDGNFAFIVSEMSRSSLQVFDLTRLRNAVPPTVFSSDAVYEGFGSAHNIAINTETHFAYAVGSDTCSNGTERGGLHMVNISNPRSPRSAGCALMPGNDPAMRRNNYVHDAQCVIYRGPDVQYRGREICFGSNEAVVAIYDVTNKAAPKVLSQTGYPSAQYTHQGWLTPDHRYFLFGDELDELRSTVEWTTTYVLNVSDLDSPSIPRRFTHPTTAIDHNMYVKGNHVFQSNYTAGLRILQFDKDSLSIPVFANVGYFDVYPANDSRQFAGTWSNYPFFASGVVIVSVIEGDESGLFVLKPNLKDVKVGISRGQPNAGSASGSAGRSGSSKAGASKPSGQLSPKGSAGPAAGGGNSAPGDSQGAVGDSLVANTSDSISPFAGISLAVLAVATISLIAVYKRRKKARTAV